jgi:cytochrome P450
VEATPYISPSPRLLCALTPTLQSAAAVHAALQALTLYPEVQRLAQAEIDSIIGRDRFPEHADLPFLPYVTAICREVFRWHAIGPLGAPRSAISDDMYEGWLIPAGKEYPTRPLRKCSP